MLLPVGASTRLQSGLALDSVPVSGVEAQPAVRAIKAIKAIKEKKTRFIRCCFDERKGRDC